MNPTLATVQVHPMPFPWFRVVDTSNHIWGSGESPEAAQADAARELRRRNIIAKHPGGAA